MPNYQVGNLEIAFKTIDETSADFKKLATNLRAIQKLIVNIGNADIMPFVNNIKALRKEMTPLLTKISGASQGIADFNAMAKQFGIRNISKAIQGLQGVANVASEATESVKDIAEAIDRYDDKLQETSNSLALVATEQSRVSVAWDNLNRLMSFNSYDKILASVGGLAHEWRNLYTTLSVFGEKGDEVTKGMFSVEAEQRLRSISQRYFEQKEVIEQTNRAFREMEEQYRRSKLSAEELTIEEYKNAKAKVQQQIEYYKAKIAMAGASESTEEYKAKLAELTAELNRLNGVQEKSVVSTNKATSGWTKFIKSIGRIALYRAIRRALQLITQSITETIQEFAKLDDNINDIVSTATSSLKVIQFSFGTAFLPLLQAIQPILAQIADGFASFANSISQAMATGDTYWAINSKAIKDYREQLDKTTGSLASFDKIQSLNAKDDNSIFFEERKVEKEKNSLSGLASTIMSIADLIKSVFDIIAVAWRNVVKPILDVVIPIINLIVVGLTNVVKWVANVFKKFEEWGILKPLLLTIGVALAGLFAPKIIKGITTLISKFNLWYLAVAAVGLAIGIISNWDNFNQATKTTISIIATLITLFTSLAIAVLAYKGALTAGVAVPLILTAVSAGAVAIRGMIDSAQNAIRGFADGGLPDKGTMFFAGEAGAEMVYNMPSGQSGVANISQIETAFYNALVRYGRESGGSDGRINVNIDGQKVFEAVQRTAGRKGLGFSRV